MKNKILTERILLEEPEEDLPDVEIEEPIVISDEPPIEEVPSEIEANALSGVINDEISDTWLKIEHLKSIIATFSMGESTNEDVVAILNQILDETTIHIGMLQKAIELIDNKPSELIDTGKDKAEEIISTSEDEIEKEEE